MKHWCLRASLMFNWGAMTTKGTCVDMHVTWNFSGIMNWQKHLVFCYSVKRNKQKMWRIMWFVLWRQFWTRCWIKLYLTEIATTHLIRNNQTHPVHRHIRSIMDAVQWRRQRSRCAAVNGQSGPVEHITKGLQDKNHMTKYCWWTWQMQQ